MNITAEETVYIVKTCKFVAAIIAKDYNRNEDAEDFAQDLAIFTLRAIEKNAPARATMRTYIAAIIRKGKGKIIRRILAERKRENEPNADEPISFPAETQDNCTDVDTFRKTLPPDLQSLASEIIDGSTFAEMRKLHNMTTEQLRTKIRLIRTAGLKFWKIGKGTTDTPPVRK